ncbi:HLA class II histocompatibility DQ beta 1 chain-like isoform X1 [Babesia ovata]|uniref:HLA class II histocompatibility DQ beta 1 chain-like isoform X1 n=1 Tax=Babesia ovata TaxID=189622 RepID=A0A2H6KA72_9APIC|nr:HLA class II histocompatibility DQ beta 1 chain-like isoform X1 [Babesia ovata]GBE59897.1 HLA class II histocompatibility DQ beta 1 chain-like isoform X1 [Babesia ovata]
MQFGALDNAYNASHEPIKGFSRHRLNGAHKFNRDEHFIYLRQYERSSASGGKGSSTSSGTKGATAAQQQMLTAAKLRRNAAMIPPPSDAHVRRRIRKLSIAAACGATLMFAAATTIGIYW